MLYSTTIPSIVYRKKKNSPMGEFARHEVWLGRSVVPYEPFGVGYFKNDLNG
jgi:hypothetical protein